MKRIILLPLLLVPALGAQEAVTLDQSLQFNSVMNRVGQGDWTSSSVISQAAYEFTVGAPLLEYRLGTLSLGSALGYDKLSTGSASDSDFGLRSTSLAGSLFPYQPYHVTFDVSRAKAPHLFGSGDQITDTFGLGLTYRGPVIQGVRLDYRHGDYVGDFGHQSWSLFTMTGSQRYTWTDVNYYADQTGIGAGGITKRISAGMNARTILSRDWTWMNQVTAQGTPGNQAVQAGSDLSGIIGPWTSLSSLNTSYQDANLGGTRMLTLAQSLAYTQGRLSSFAQAGLTGASGFGAFRDSTTAELLNLGVSYRLTPQWNLSADAGKAWTGAPQSAGGSGSVRGGSGLGGTTSMHVGASWGGSLTDQLKHALFYYSDLRLQQQLQEDYPPGFMPPEVTEILMRRRMSREGGLRFTGDAYHLKNDSGREDWLRASGNLSFRNGFMFEALADWRRDDGFFQPNYGSLERDLSLSSAFRAGRVQMHLGMGASNSTSLASSGGNSAGAFLGQGFRGPVGSRTFYTVGLDAPIFGIPWGALLLRTRDAFGLETSTFTTHLSGAYRSIGYGVTFSQGYQSNGLRNSQITVNLRRWFDTMSLWGPED